MKPFLLCLILVLGASSSVAPPFKLGEFCTEPHQAALAPRPHGPGPLILLSVDCQWGEMSRIDLFDPQLSPDGTRLAVFGGSTIDGTVRAMRLHDREATTFYDGGLDLFDRSSGASDPPIHWDADSQFIWTARRDQYARGAGASLKPIRLTVSGEATDLPPLNHPAGPLDALQWVGGTGRAVAEFGTRGYRYKPEIENPSPTLAFVDAARGTILDDFPLSKVPEILAAQNSDRLMRRPGAVVPVQMPDGRMRAILDFGGPLLLWTEGERPQVVQALPHAEYYAFLPGGRAILLARPVLPNERGGWLYMSCGGGRHGPCPPREPHKATLISLHDSETGAMIWSAKATFDVRDRFPRPAVSPDGRFALVGLAPSSSQPDATAPIALVSLASGKTVQTIPAPTGGFSMGFAENGRTVWVRAAGYVASYGVNATQRRAGLR
jgi:hypothetical protein